MLNMRITRAPLSEAENSVILSEYNRLTGGRIPLDEFVRWVTKSPEGPAWHAILQTDEGRIVGHTSVFPLRAGRSPSRIIPGKSEYSFLHEDFRKEKIRGYESAGRPAFIILLDQLFQHCHERGWSPIFASTNEKNQVFTRKVGLRPLEFSLWECLLVLKPIGAAKRTPNLGQAQRAALFSAGLLHRAVWPSMARVLALSNGTKSVPVPANGIEPSEKPLSFFEDPVSLEWRYIDGQYLRIGLASSTLDYAIAKRGSSDRFLRVCQWRLGSQKSLYRVLPFLVREAVRDGALGVRWAVYEQDQSAHRLVAGMKRLGLLCARRTRIVMVHKNNEKYLDGALWGMNDSLWSFDP